jgi:hypothetical protein
MGTNEESIADKKLITKQNELLGEIDKQMNECKDDGNL